MDREVLRQEYNLKSKGQWIGFAALITMLAVIAFMVVQGFATQATTLGVGTLAVVVGVFVLGRRLQPSPDEQTH